MNKNVERINNKLLMVNFDYLDQGYIEELSQFANNHSIGLFISSDGVMVLDEGAPTIVKLAPFFNFVMKLNDEEIQENEAFKIYKSKANPNILRWNDSLLQTYIGYHHLEDELYAFNFVSKHERERRQLEKLYKKKNRVKLMARKLLKKRR